MCSKWVKSMFLQTVRTLEHQLYKQKAKQIDNKNPSLDFVARQSS